MEDEPKKVPFNWKYGEETVSLYIDTYREGNRLAIELIDYEDGEPESFMNLTENLPNYPLKPNEAFISNDFCDDILNFIKENELGDILPTTVRSGFADFKTVAFDMDKLKEFDPEAVEKYMELHQQFFDQIAAQDKTRNMEIDTSSPESPAGGVPQHENNHSQPRRRR